MAIHRDHKIAVQPDQRFRSELAAIRTSEWKEEKLSVLQRTFNRFLSKSKRTHTLSPFATQMKQMKNGWLIKNTALEKTNQEPCFSLNGPHVFLLLKIIWGPETKINSILSLQGSRWPEHSTNT